jgi:hypothetical protein
MGCRNLQLFFFMGAINPLQKLERGLEMIRMQSQLLYMYKRYPVQKWPLQSAQDLSNFHHEPYVMC